MVEMEEKVLQGVLNDPYNNMFVRTGSPNIICTILPDHWRSNKQLPYKFKVVVLGEVEDNTLVRLSAANENNERGDLKNNEAYISNHIAVFHDLRFIGRSGRGKYFHLVITVNTRPSQVAVLFNAIKVTIDGPRLPRTKVAEKKKNYDAKLALKRKSTEREQILERHNPDAIKKNFTHTYDNANRTSLPLDLNSTNNISSTHTKTSIATNFLSFSSSVTPFPCVIPILLPVNHQPRPQSLSCESEYSSQSLSPFGNETSIIHF